MDVLNGKTLLEAVKLCEECKNINVCIVFDNAWSLSDFAEAVRSEIKLGRISDWKIGEGELGEYAVLKSPNDSFIHLINGRDPRWLKSRSFDLVLYESGISNDIMQFVRSIEHLPSDDIKSEENEELDLFLNSFKVI